MISKGAETGLGPFLLHLWRMSRPRIWMVSVFPLYTGYVLASRQIAPGFILWAGFWDRAAVQGTGAEDFAVTLLGSLALATPLMMALLAMGPLLWAATLLWNDIYDLDADKHNPRHQDTPLVRGAMSSKAAQWSGWAAAPASLGAGAAAGASVAAAVAGCLMLAWTYSAPPFRLKERPGLDVAVNALGIGLLAVLAGWSLSRPVAAFPVAFAVQGMLVAVAVYVPTTLVDHDADATLGLRTLSTHLGPRRAYLVGWWAWVLANMGALSLSAAGILLTRRMLPLLLLFVPILLYEYHALIGKADTPQRMVQGIVTTSLTFAAVCGAFALMHTGMWLP